MTVLGAGNSGFGLAAALALKEIEVCVFELPEFSQSIEPIIEQGGIRTRGIVGEGLVRISKVTTDVREALAHADVVLMSVPAIGYRRMALECAPHLGDRHVVVLMPGNCGGALYFSSLVRGDGRNHGVVVAEASSFNLACKKDGPGSVWIRGLKKGLPIATFPACHTDRVAAVLQAFFPDVEVAANVLETSLQNNNHIIHPPAALLNVGRFEKQGGDWSFFHEGMTQSVCRLMEAIDRERIQVCKAYNVRTLDVLESTIKFYGHQGFGGATLYEALSTTPVHGASRAPASIEHRYFTEDIPYGLVPMARLADAAGIAVPTVRAMVDVVNGTTGQDFWASGWSLQDLGLADLDRRGVLQYVDTGER